MSAVYKGVVYMVIGKASPCLLSFLIFAQNQRNWTDALNNTLDPAGSLQVKAQADTNVEAIYVWIYSTWTNVSGIMHPLGETPAINREATALPDFLFPSQVASLMLVQTEDLLPLIAPIFRPRFGAVMALRNRTQPLKISASTPTFSILHFVKADNSQ